MIHHQRGTHGSWWDCENVALSPLVCSLFYFYCCSESLSMVLSFATWQKFALYISLFSSFTLLLKKEKKKSLCFISFSFFLWSDAFFIKAIDLLQCLNDPDLTHTPHKLYRLKINAQTIRGREADEEGGCTQARTASADTLVPTVLSQSLFGKVTLALFTCTAVVLSES